MLPTAASIVVGPSEAPVATPVAETVATFVADEVHVAYALMLLWLLSEKYPVAVNCWVAPMGSETFWGATEIEVRVGTVKPTPLLGAELTTTTTFPVVAPQGTVVAICPLLQLVAVASVPLN